MASRVTQRIEGKLNNMFGERTRTTLRVKITEIHG